MLYLFIICSTFANSFFFSKSMLWGKGNNSYQLRWWEIANWTLDTGPVTVIISGVDWNEIHHSFIKEIHHRLTEMKLSNSTLIIRIMIHIYKKKYYHQIQPIQLQEPLQMESNNLFEANHLFITKKYLLLFTVLESNKKYIKRHFKYFWAKDIYIALYE